MKFVVLLAAAVSAFDTTESAFLSYISEFGKVYGTIEEYKFRFD